MHGHAAHASKPCLRDAQLVPTRHKGQTDLLLVHCNEYYTTFRPRERAGDGRIFILLNILPRAPREIHDARFPEAALAHDLRRRVHDGVARTGLQMVAVHRKDRRVKVFKRTGIIPKTHLQERFRADPVHDARSQGARAGLQQVVRHRTAPARLP